MQYVGDAVMAVFGAPMVQTDHAERSMRAAESMHRRQHELNSRWLSSGLEAFGLGIGLSTGDVAAALLGSEERLEYTVVGDTVNLAQRLQDLARPSGVTVISSATMALLHDAPAADALPSQQVKGRDTPIQAYRIVHQPLQQEEQA